jgi:hypothetical protein
MGATCCQQFQRGRVAPVQIFDDQQQRLSSRQIVQQIEQYADSALFLCLRRQCGRRFRR